MSSVGKGAKKRALEIHHSDAVDAPVGCSKEQLPGAGKIVEFE